MKGYGGVGRRFGRGGEWAMRATVYYYREFEKARVEERSYWFGGIGSHGRLCSVGWSLGPNMGGGYIYIEKKYCTVTEIASKVVLP